MPTSVPPELGQFTDFRTNPGPGVGQFGKLFPEVEKVPVQSKGIDWVAYDEEAQTLDVHFGESRTYRYFDVPDAVYDWLLRAQSKGKFVNRLVKDRYRYERLDEGSRTEADADLRALLEKSLDEPR